MVAGFVQIVINTSIIILELTTWKITVLNVDLEWKKRGINKMDEPIISPWLIYLIGSVDGVLAWVITIGLCSLALAVACFIESTTSYYEKNEKSKWYRRSKIFMIVSIIFISLFTLIPNSRTLTSLILIQYITPNNIKATNELSSEVVKNGLDYLNDKVIEIIREMKK